MSGLTHLNSSNLFKNSHYFINKIVSRSDYPLRFVPQHAYHYIIDAIVNIHQLPLGSYTKDVPIMEVGVRIKQAEWLACVDYVIGLRDIYLNSRTT